MRFIKILKVLYFFVVFSLMAPNAFGQPTNPSVDPDTVPISGLEILLAGGAVLGVKRLLDKRKAK